MARCTHTAIHRQSDEGSERRSGSIVYIEPSWISPGDDPGEARAPDPKDGIASSRVSARDPVTHLAARVVLDAFSFACLSRDPHLNRHRAPSCPREARQAHARRARDRADRQWRGTSSQYVIGFARSPRAPSSNPCRHRTRRRGRDHWRARRRPRSFPCPQSP